MVAIFTVYKLETLNQNKMRLLTRDVFKCAIKNMTTNTPYSKDKKLDGTCLTAGVRLLGILFS